MKPATELFKDAEVLHDQADARADEVKKAKAQDAKMVVVQGLASKGKNAQDLLRKWDKNSDGDVSKTEFRQGIRGAPPMGLGLDVDVKDIETIFDECDTNGTGSLEIKELHEALQKMKQTAKEEERRSNAVQEAIDKLRSRGDAVMAIAQMTEAVEKAEVALDEKCDKLPAGAQLGTLMMRKNLKVVDILIKWDENGDGNLDMTEFRYHARQLGVHATDESINDIFLEYDTDKKGSLDLQELKGMLRSVSEQAKVSAADIASDEKTLEKLRKTVKRKQVSLALETVTESRLALEKEAEQRRLEEEFKDRMIRESASPNKKTVADMGLKNARKALAPTPEKLSSPGAGPSPDGGDDEVTVFASPRTSQVLERSAITEGELEEGEEKGEALPPRAADAE